MSGRLALLAACAMIAAGCGAHHSARRAVVVPRVVGLQQQEAMARLVKAGLCISDVTSFYRAPTTLLDGTPREGVVLSQWPKPGIRTRFHGVASLTVSAGAGGIYEERAVSNGNGCPPMQMLFQSSDQFLLSQQTLILRAAGHASP
jgi:hypothetical protein